MDKLRPIAYLAYSSGNDGRDDHYYISYTCPKCDSVLMENDMACDKCGTFLDWSKKATIKIKREIVWE